MPRGNAFVVEHAKSNMATCRMLRCRVCMAKIPKDALRVGHIQVEAPRPDGGGDEEEEDDVYVKAEKRMMAVAAAPRWHHFECFNKMKGAKWFAANLPADPSAVKGFSALPKLDQRRLSALWRAILASGPSSAAGKRKAEGSTEVSEAKRRKAADGAAATIAKLTSVQGVLELKDFKKIQQLEAELSSATAAQLQAELLKNRQVRTGHKEELVQRVAEGRHLGAIPPCPRCIEGRVHWSRVGGWYSCPGHFDPEAMIQKRCNYRTREMKRVKWQK